MQRPAAHNSLQATVRHQSVTAGLVGERADARNDAPQPRGHVLRQVLPEVGEAPHGGSRGFVECPAGVATSRRVYFASPDGYAVPVLHGRKTTEDSQ